MPPLPPLFTLPIALAGTITCTQPSPKIYLLTFESPPDNRLTPSFCNAFLLALDILAHRYPNGVVVSTSGIAKFYSNGLDLEAALKTKDFFKDILYPLWIRLITYPMPTVALINGHAFAGGLMTAMMHDYRLMNPQRGFVCINELEFGAPLLPPMSSIFRQKVPSPQTYRALALEAKRFPAADALSAGIVDATAAGLPEALTWIAGLGLASKGRSGIYGRLKREMWRETVGYLEKAGDEEEGGANYGRDQKAREEHEKGRVEELERERRAGKPRL